MPHPVGPDRVRQRLGHVLLTDQLIKGLRAVPPSNDHVVGRAGGCGRGFGGAGTFGEFGHAEKRRREAER